jgi:hypothetical protein
MVARVLVVLSMVRALGWKDASLLKKMYALSGYKVFHDGGLCCNAIAGGCSSVRLSKALASCAVCIVFIRSPRHVALEWVVCVFCIIRA